MCLNVSKQGSFVSEMEWAPLSVYFETLMNANKVNGFYYKPCFFVVHALLLKYVKSWQRQIMQKTYDNIKVDFLWL